MVKVGLTGGVASGKSTVLSMFAKLGVAVLSADKIVHQEFKTNRRLGEALREAFGRRIFKNGRLDKAALAKIVFSRRRLLGKLNSMIHPQVWSKTEEFIKAHRNRKGSGVVVAEIPLLFEAGFDKLFNITICVVTKPDIQRARALKESRATHKDLIVRLRHQLSTQRRTARCDFLIDNNGTRFETFRQVKELMYFFKKM